MNITEIGTATLFNIQWSLINVMTVIASAKYDTENMYGNPKRSPTTNTAIVMSENVTIGTKMDRNWRFPGS